MALVLFCGEGLRHCSRPGAEQFPVSLGQRVLLQFMRVPTMILCRHIA